MYWIIQVNSNLNPHNICMHNWLTPDWPAPSNIKAVTTTKIGGVSKGAFDSMNLADHVEDDPQAVQANRAMLKEQLRLPGDPCWPTQVHGTDVVSAMEAKTGAGVGPGIGTEADGVYSLQSGEVCAVLTADCLPVLICDKAGTRIAAVHAGWRGLLAGVMEAALEKLEIPGSETLVWLGPAIGPNAFEVGEEVRNQFIGRDPLTKAAFQQSSADRWWLDIVRLASIRLSIKGVNQVYGGDWCTFTDRERFYSYRRDGVTGRMASLIWIDSQI